VVGSESGDEKGNTLPSDTYLPSVAAASSAGSMTGTATSTGAGRAIAGTISVADTGVGMGIRVMRTISEGDEELDSSAHSTYYHKDKGKGKGKYKGAAHTDGTGSNMNVLEGRFTAKPFIPIRGALISTDMNLGSTSSAVMDTRVDRGGTGADGDGDDTTPATLTTEEFVPKSKNPWDTTRDLFSSLTFWRFTAFTLMLINLKTIFRHLDATLPTYLVRTFGDSVPKGTIYSINPFMIMFLTPIVAALTTKYAHFDMIKYGGYLTALSPFFLAASTSIWATVCMIVVLSLGEAIWSPRTYDYTMSIAPEVNNLHLHPLLFFYHHPFLTLFLLPLPSWWHDTILSYNIISHHIIL
jgi:Major Facilitator Superfamily